MNRARERESVRWIASQAKETAKKLRDSDTCVGVILVIEGLADAVEKLADISEDQEAS